MRLVKGDDDDDDDVEDVASLSVPTNMFEWLEGGVLRCCQSERRSGLRRSESILPVLGGTILSFRR